MIWGAARGRNPSRRERSSRFIDRGAARSDARPRESRTDQRPLSGGHARRLRALTPAAHLLAWKLETK